MKFRHTHRAGEKIQLQMTPMIDIVFQLLIFFILTFKVNAQEGDFHIKMPTAAPSAAQMDPTLLPPLQLRLQADSQGHLAAISLGDRSFGRSTWQSELRSHIIRLVGSDVDPGSSRESAEIELDVDYNLRYEYTIQAITTVSGYVDSNTGRVVPLIEKIRFASPDQPSGE